MSYKRFRFSPGTIERISQDIQTGAADDFVKAFFAARPDWQDKTNAQTDDQTEKAEQKKETAQA